MRVQEIDERLSELVKNNCNDAKLCLWHPVEESDYECAYIVLWRNEREYGTHRACLARDKNVKIDAMLVSGHYIASQDEALMDYQARVGRLWVGAS